jgi:hypothetical protein
VWRLVFGPGCAFPILDNWASSAVDKFAPTKLWSIFLCRLPRSLSLSVGSLKSVGLSNRCSLLHSTRRFRTLDSTVESSRVGSDNGKFSFEHSYRHLWQRKLHHGRRFISRRFFGHAWSRLLSLSLVDDHRI